MGSVILPSSGVIYVDAQVVIYTVERHVLFAQRLEPLWASADSGNLTVVTSELTVMETAIIPLRDRNQEVIDLHSHFLAQSSIRVAPITRPILWQAAHLRAQSRKLRTPDSIHLATCFDTQCDVFLTNDFALRSMPGVNVVIVSDLTSVLS